MPNYFKLISKETGEPKVFQELDNEMREHFNVPPDPEKWLYSWYDFIGLGLAMGKTFDELRGFVHEDEKHIHKVIDYIDERYTADAWYSPKR